MVKDIIIFLAFFFAIDEFRGTFFSHWINYIDFDEYKAETENFEEKWKSVVSGSLWFKNTYVQ